MPARIERPKGRRSTQGVAALFVSIICAVVAGGWAVFTYLFPKEAHGVTNSASAPGGIAIAGTVSNVSGVTLSNGAPGHAKR